MITIEESSMRFGPYDEKQVFYIEKSHFYRTLKNVRSTEFIYFPRIPNGSADIVYFIEAKKSTPNPILSGAEWERFAEEIGEKFTHSCELFLSAILERNFQTEKCEGFKAINPAQMHLVFILVINGHKGEWLPPITEKLSQKLRAHRQIWKSDIIVLNEVMAQKLDLVNRKFST